MNTPSTDTREYLTLDDIRAATPELLDEWFPAWRAVAADILRLAVEQPTPTEGTTSAIPR